MIRAAAIFAATLAASPVLADCEALLGRDAGAAAHLFAPAAADCQTARQMTGEALFCYSEHPFRSETAVKQARQLEAALTACFGEIQTTEDAAVNHPDSYDARHFDVKDARISLSIKDKGALGKTLVFLRIVEAN